MPPSSTSSPTSSTAVEDYLEQILRLIESKGYARAVDIAAALQVSPASVSNMVQRLDADGLLVREKYRGMVLTEEGEVIARAVIERHGVLTRILEPFGLDAETLYRDVEGMEHHISGETLAILEAVASELEADEKLIARIRKRLVAA